MTEKSIPKMTLEGKVTEVPEKKDGFFKVVIRVERASFSSDPCDIVEIMPMATEVLPIFMGDMLRVTGPCPVPKYYDGDSEKSLAKYLEKYKGIAWLPEEIILLDNSMKPRAIYRQYIDGDPILRKGFHQGEFRW